MSQEVFSWMYRIFFTGNYSNKNEAIKAMD
jgi:hypothetical protein